MRMLSELGVGGITTHSKVPASFKAFTSPLIFINHSLRINAVVVVGLNFNPNPKLRTSRTLFYCL